MVAFSAIVGFNCKTIVFQHPRRFDYLFATTRTVSHYSSISH